METMKKTGMLIGIGFLAGAIFFALTFGFVQKSGSNRTVISPTVAQADSLNSPPASEIGQTINFVPIVKKVKPAVVQVFSTFVMEAPTAFDDDFFGQFFNMPRRKQKGVGYGSGFFISPDGYILTNNHVVEKAIKVKISTLDAREFTAKIVGTDPRTDLALLKIDAKNLPYIELGDSSKLEVGEWVLAIGNPLEQAFTVTAGIISAEGRQLGMADYEDFIQTDAPINRGNSGGPLVNMRAEAIGINSTILAPAGGNVGIGFSIPSNMAKKVVSDLKAKGKVVRGWFGISLLFLNESRAKEYDQPMSGALVTSVEAGSPAEKAGLKQNDLIVEINGERVDSQNHLRMKIADSNPGDTLKVTLFRNNAKVTLDVKVGEAPTSSGGRTQQEEVKGVELGMTLENNTPALARELQLKVSRGVVVTEIERGSAAYESNLQVGDVILQINRTPISNVDQFRSFMARRDPGSSVLLFVNRYGQETTLQFVIPEE